MKIKYTLFAWSCLLYVLLAAACVDDEGNYTYRNPDDILPIEISGLEDTSLIVLNEVTLTPEIKGLKEGQEYEFVWYAYPVTATGFIPKRDTLGQERNLTFLMKYPAGEPYQLVYQIKDKQTGIFVNKKIIITGTSEFAVGWYVMKDENEKTDMDFIYPDGRVVDNLMLKSIGEQLKGTAVKVVYQDRFYTHQIDNPDGTVTTLRNKRVIHVLSSEGMKTLSAEELSVYKDFKESFYGTPDIARPQNMLFLGFDLYLLNAGCIYSLSGMGANVGKMGAPKIGANHLADDLLGYSGGNSSVLGFDEEKHSFVYADAWSADMQEVLDTDPTGSLEVSPLNMNASMIRMVQRNNTAREGTSGWAIMESISGKKEYYLADILFNGARYPFTDFDTISPSREFLTADVYGTHFLNNFYFAKGNVLSYYQKNTSDENSIEKINIWPHFKANEKISYISQMKTSDNAKEPFNYLVVVTNSPEGWSLYRFNLVGSGVSPEIQEFVEPVFRGKGNARYVIYRE